MLGFSPAAPRRYQCGMTSADPSSTPPPSTGELFRAFASMSLHGFGGALPWARRAIVDEKRWMTAQDMRAWVGETKPAAPAIAYLDLGHAFP